MNRKQRRAAARLGRSREQRVLHKSLKHTDMLIEVDAARILKGKPAKYLLRNEDPAQVLEDLEQMLGVQNED